MQNDKQLIEIILSLDKFLDEVLLSNYFLGTDYQKQAFKLKLKTECFLADCDCYYYRNHSKFKFGGFDV